MLDTASNSKFLPLLTLITIGILFFVWPIAHTIALRNTLLLASVILSSYLVYVQRIGISEILLKQLRAPTIAYFLLTAWIFIVALAISPETSWSINEVSGQWLPGLLSIWIGLIAAILKGKKLPGEHFVFHLVFTMLLLHVLYINYAAVAGLWQNGELIRDQVGLTSGPENSNYLTNMLLSMLVVETIFRHVYKIRHIPISNTTLFFVLCLTLFSAHVEARRNGLIVLFFLFIFVVVFYFLERHTARIRKSIVIAFMLSFSAVGLTTFFSISSDSRWLSLKETIPIAWDTEQHKAWLDNTKHPLPNLSNGEPVSGSNYTRIAFLKEGAKLVLDHPLGIGYGRNAFQHGLEMKYGHAQVGHSHSGIIDLAIGIGIPGVTLWFALMASLLYLACKAFVECPNFYATLLIILIMDFNLRMLVDSINRDHSLHQFLFLIGLFTLMMLRHGRSTTKERESSNQLEIRS